MRGRRGWRKSSDIMPARSFVRSEQKPFANGKKIQFICLSMSFFSIWRFYSTAEQLEGTKQIFDIFFPLSFCAHGHILQIIIFPPSAWLQFEHVSEKSIRHFSSFTHCSYCLHKSPSICLADFYLCIWTRRNICKTQHERR